jgi:PKD repeat protein
MKTYRWLTLVGLAVFAVMLSGCALLNAPPTANFSWSPMEPLARTEITFTDLSTDSGGPFGGGGVVSWNWSFGDSDSSTAQNPKHEYDKSGMYTVQLTVTDAQGESSTFSKTINVTASVGGTWRGYIDDGSGFLNDMELVFTHSASGGIQGTAYMLMAQLSCSSISFDPIGKRLQFQLIDLGIRLDGTLDASETRITGLWYILGAPFAGWSWDVTLQQ